MHLHFLRAIGTAMSMRAGIAADAAAALLFRVLSQPALLFPPLRQVEGFEFQHEPLDGYISSYKKQVLVTCFHCLCPTNLFFGMNASSFWSADHAFIYLNLLFYTHTHTQMHMQTYV